MRIVITGAAGFLGSHLCDRFLADGHTVVGLDNFVTGHPDNIAHLMGESRFEFVRHDISDVHLRGRRRWTACCISPRRPARSTISSCPSRRSRWDRSARTTRWGWPGRRGRGSCWPRRPRYTATRSSTRSARSYWGNVNPIGPRGVYDEAKRFAEAMTMAYHRYHGLDTRIVRIFNTYGPRMRPRDGRVVSNFIVQALNGEPITIYGDGRQTRSFCYVEDEVEGIFRLFMKGDHMPTNIGNPDGVHGHAARRDREGPHRQPGADRAPAAARGRPQGAPARHHPGPDDAGMGAPDRSARGAGSDHRVLPVADGDVAHGGSRSAARAETGRVRVRPGPAARYLSHPMHRQTRGLVAALALGLAAAACRPAFVVTKFPTNEALFKASLTEFNQHRWDNAVEGFDKLTLDLGVRDTLLVPSYWYLGLAHERAGDDLLAAQAFSRLVESFPDDSLGPRAALEAGRSYQRLWRDPSLDQHVRSDRASDVHDAHPALRPDRYHRRRFRAN